MHPDEAATTVDLLALAHASTVAGAIWSGGVTDLHVNLVRLPTGDTITSHRNDEVEVLLVGLEGSATVTVADTANTLGAGQALVIPRGTVREVVAGEAGVVYLTCHRRRGAIQLGRRGSRPA